MRRKIFAALLVLGVTGQATAQDPAANLTNALGNLLPNLTNTTEALLAQDVTGTTLGLSATVTDLTADLTAGTPLAPLAIDTNGYMGLITPNTRMIDEALAGDIGPGDIADDLQKLATFDPKLVVTLVQGTLRDPSSTALNPETGLLIVQSLIPIEGLDSLGGGALDPLALLGGGAGGAPDLGTLTGLLGGGLPAGDLPVDALDLAVLTTLLAGGDVAGSPLDALPLGSLLSLSGGGVGGGLPAGDLPLPVDALDLGTLTGLLSGASLPGL